jgi:hypothetical protein
MNYPEIRFRDSFLLINTIYNDIEASYMPPITDTDERNKLSRETINKKLEEYEKAWQPYESKIVEGMCKVIGAEFKQNVIDIYAAPFYSSFSFPMIIATKYEPDRAIEVIAHELIHVLLYDNTSSDLDLDKKEDEWRELFTEITDGVALIHIPVHAVLQAVFDDVLKEPSRTKRDKEMCSNYLPYKAAWDYVENVGYKEIINRIRQQQFVRVNLLVFGNRIVTIFL